MKKVCVVFGIIVLSSGFSGLQVAQDAPEANQIYAADCAKSGYQEKTQPYKVCILRTWEMAE